MKTTRIFVAAATSEVDQAIAMASLENDMVLTLFPAGQVSFGSNLDDRVISLEEACEKAELNWLRVTETATSWAKRLVSSFAASQLSGQDLREHAHWLENQIRHDLLKVAQLYHLLISDLYEDVTEAVFLRHPRTFGVPTRSDISFLDNSDDFNVLVASCVLSSRGVVVYFPQKAGLIRSFVATDAIRSWAISFFLAARQFLKGLGSWRIGAHPKVQGQIAVLVRAKTEYESVSTVVQHFRASGLPVSILVQSRTRNGDIPPCLERQDHQVLFLHKVISPWKSLFRWFQIQNRVTFSGAVRRWRARKDWHSGKVKTPEALFERLASNAVETLFAETSQFREALLQCSQATSVRAFLTMDMIDRWGAVVGDVARELKKTSFTLQNATIELGRYPRPLSTDWFFVDAPSTKSTLVLSGAPSDKIEVTGLPQYDKLLRVERERPTTEPSTRHQCKPVQIVLATQPFPNDEQLNEDALQSLLEYCQTPEFNLFVQVHPRDDLDRYLTIVSPRNLSHPPVVGRLDIWDALAMADIWVTRTSTTIEQAVLARTPVVAYMNGLPMGEKYSRGALQTGVLRIAPDRDALFTRLNEICSLIRAGEIQADTERRRRLFVTQYYGGDSRKQSASELVAHRVRQIVGLDSSGL